MQANLHSISSLIESGTMERIAFFDASLFAYRAIISRSLLNSRESREVWGIKDFYLSEFAVISGGDVDIP